MNTASKGPAYDRQLLLEGAKRNAVLDLIEVQRYGIESWGDPDYVCIYGLRPADWYGKGIRILGRTAVECTRDELGNVAYHPRRPLLVFRVAVYNLYCRDGFRVT